MLRTATSATPRLDCHNATCDNPLRCDTLAALTTITHAMETSRPTASAKTASTRPPAPRWPRNDLGPLPTITPPD